MSNSEDMSVSIIDTICNGDNILKIHELLYYRNIDIANAVYKDIIAPLDDTYAKVSDVIPKFKGNLYDHQKRVVQAMLDLENKKTYLFEHEKINTRIMVHINAGFLSEPVGSGKTIEILSLICKRKTLVNMPEYMYYDDKLNIKNWEITKLCRRGKYTQLTKKQFINSNLIFVGLSVLNQWEEAVKKFTDLNVLFVKNVKDLRVMLNLIDNKTIDMYDAVIVKNGTVTSTYTLPKDIILDSLISRTMRPSIYNIISNLYNHYWSRVIIDDFDVINLPNNFLGIGAVFTWYVSSTYKPTNFVHLPISVYKLHNNGNYHYDNDISSEVKLNFLSYVCNIRNADIMMDMPFPKYHAVILTNPDDKIISMFSLFDDDNVNKLTEMLNGDAINEAAVYIGINTTSISDIFSRVLGEQTTNYNYATNLLKFIETQELLADERKSMQFNPDDRYYKSDLLSYREIKYKYPGVNSLLRNTKEEYMQLKERSGLAIERVRSNLSHGSCPICLDDLNDDCDIIIVKCCNSVFCSRCGLLAQDFIDKGDVREGRCSMCRSKIKITDLIYVGKDININDIINIVDIDVETPIENKEAEQKNKYQYISDIVRGVPVENDLRINIQIPNMMIGTKDLPEASIRKVLVFASFKETLCHIYKQFTDDGIAYTELKGKSEQITQIIKDFNESTVSHALIINSGKHCAGLNLQTATDLIFTHYVADSNIESQVIGRGHRIGRTTPLNIWYILYDNEYQTMKQCHTITEL